MNPSSYRKPCGNKTMGMEIECLIPENVAYALRQHIGFWTVKPDGSIRSTWTTLGREFASQPLTHEWLIKEINKLWAALKAAQIAAGIDDASVPWTQNDSCGIHIHVNRKWLSERRAKAIYAWYNTLSDSDAADIFGRSSNDYCRKNRWGMTRYAAINSENLETFEFRMFASGDAQWTIYCANLTKWMIENHAHLNVDAALAVKAMHFGN